MSINPERVITLAEGEQGKGPVIYWMSRDQRAKDNWALIYAQELALRHDSPLAVAFCLVPEFLGAASRQYNFMLLGIKEVERSLRALNIPFFLLWGDPEQEILHFLSDQCASILVCDFSPLRTSRGWKEQVARQAGIPCYEIDAHNIIPCWLASPKQEWAAYTFRPKIYRLLHGFLQEFPALRSHPVPWKGEIENDWVMAERSIRADVISEVPGMEPGEAAAARVLGAFIEHKLSRYDSERNDPNQDGQSHLSPYLHFGQIAAQRVALEVLASERDARSAQAFLEELIVHKELSDNFCYYNHYYDSFQGFPAWARKTLEDHLGDSREYLYTREDLEKARTHDRLWNAAQLEMVHLGRMHGYMRMYWAKKILEWTDSPEAAQRAAIFLNDRYEMDGRDPSGYTGIAWSIGGVHDRAWRERKVFGKVRYMSYQGASRKFDVQAYVDSVDREALEDGLNQARGSR